ncbi:hypothetical protein B0H13DRAFT_2534384 [Mycena leptocephala]|nr:hypothetical protein B0H13DRAFT_2534384 [Mycena leptocephala]
MLPLQRSRAPQSLHSWWSDSNPGGAAFPIHTLAKPLSKFLHHRAVSSIVAKSRSAPLSKGSLEVLTWYLQSRDKDIGPSTKVLILQELNRRAQWEPQTWFMVEENVHHAIVQLLGSANDNILASACRLLGTLAQWRSGNAAIVDVNPCSNLVWLVTYNDSPVVHKQAVYALSRVGQYSAAGARALIEAGAVSLTSTLLRGECLNKMSVGHSQSQRTTRRMTTNNHNSSSRDRAQLNQPVYSYLSLRRSSPGSMDPTSARKDFYRTADMPQQSYDSGSRADAIETTRTPMSLDSCVDSTMGVHTVSPEQRPHSISRPMRNCPEIQCDSTPPLSMARGPSLVAQVIHRADIIEPFILRPTLPPVSMASQTSKTIIHTVSDYLEDFSTATLEHDLNVAESNKRARLNPPAYSPYPSSPEPMDPISQSPSQPQSPARGEFLGDHLARREKASVDTQQSSNASHGGSDSVPAIDEVIAKMRLTMAPESDIGGSTTGQNANISRLPLHNDTVDTEPIIQDRFAQERKHMRLHICNPDFEDGADLDTYIPDVHEPKSDSITLPSKIIHLERKASLVEVVGDSDSDGPAMPKKTQSKKKGRATKEVVEVAPADHKLVLMIPCAEQGIQRQQLSHATTFSEALDIIHDTIGHADVDKKPALLYKLSTAGKQDEASDWAQTPTGRAKVISVKIIVADQYLHSLRMKRGAKMTGPKVNGKQKNHILDLDHTQCGDNEFDDKLDIIDKEQRYLEQLNSQRGKCQLCGPTKTCKITVAGAHYHLSNTQLRAWSHSLAVGTHDVTLTTPPNDTLFSMFFENPKAAPVESASAPIPLAQYMAMNPINPLGLVPWAMPTMSPPFHGNPTTPIMPTPTPLADWATSSEVCPTLPSSDLADTVSANSYPEISYFLKKLNELQPRRRLLKCIPKFDELDFYNIDELVKLGPAAELAQITSISLGNATYILENAKREMKRVDREIK